VIEDFDGPEPAPSRRGHVLAISVLLLVGVVAGYAAISSPELRGPYATPRPLPSLVHAPVFTPAPVGDIAPASVYIQSADCLGPAVSRPTTVVVSGQRVSTILNGQTVTTILAAVASAPCAVSWGQPPSPLPYDRVAR
jgi:hypothetical protein